MTSPAAVDPDQLLEDLAALRPSKGGHACHTGAAIATLPPEVAERVIAAMDDRTLSSTALCNVLNKHGFHLTTGNLARHRRRGEPNGCKCPRTDEGRA